MRRALILAAVGLAVAWSGAACGRDEANDPELRSLRADPIASFSPPGGRLQFDGDLEAATRYGKRQRAVVTRIFAYDEGAAVRAGRDAAIAAARSSGWTMELDRGSAEGRKSLATGEATIFIASYVDDGTPVLSIRLEHT